MNMRICSPQLGLSPTSILGGEIYDREILTQLAKLGITIDVCLPYGKPYPKVKQLNVTYLPIPFVIPPHLYNALALPFILNTYKRYHFDILRIHSPTFLGISGAIFKKLHPQVPIIGVYHWLGEGGRIGKQLTPYLVSIFDAIVCDSHFTRKQLASLYPNEVNKLYTIHNGVDRELKPIVKSESLYKRYGIPRRSLVLLFMGLFTKRKNPLFLLDLMVEISSKEKDVLLILCGQGELETAIRQKIANLNLSHNTKIFSPVFGREKNELLNFADIFVHPASDEGFSLAVIEAMAVGLPVIITRGFSADEAVQHGENGFLASNKSEWLKYLTLLTHDTKLRQIMKYKNISKAQRVFSWKQAGKKHLELLNKYCNTYKK